MTVFPLACAKGLRDQSVQAQKQTAAEQGENDKDVRTQADGAHSGRTVGQMADHHGVHDGHAHPAEFGKDERNSQPQRGAKFGAKCLETDHGRTKREKSVKRGGEKEQTEAKEKRWNVSSSTQRRWMVRQAIRWLSWGGEIPANFGSPRMGAGPSESTSDRRSPRERPNPTPPTASFAAIAAD